MEFKIGDLFYYYDNNYKSFKGIYKVNTDWTALRVSDSKPIVLWEEDHKYFFPVTSLVKALYGI